jgi:hypothetical protein
MLSAIETPDEFIELMDSIWDGNLHRSHYTNGTTRGTLQKN